MPRFGLSSVLAQMEGGTYVAPHRLTLGMFLADEWLPSQENAIRPSTLASFKLMARVYVGPRLGGTPLGRVTPRALTDFYKELQRTGNKAAGPLSPKSVRNVHGMLHLTFRDAMRWGRLARNPADLATLPRREPRRMKTWTADQLRTFLELVREDRLYAAWLVLATTGLRRGELLGLRWEDVHFEECRLSIQRTWIVVDGRAQASEPKTAKGKRTVPLPAETMAALHTHRRRQLEERMALGPGYQDGDFVFCRENGVPFHPDGFSDAFERHSKAAGLPSIRVHDVRHTWATLALRARIPAKVVSEVLGHSNIGITLDTYSHAIPAMQEEAAQKVAALIFPERSEAQ